MFSIRKKPAMGMEMARIAATDLVGYFHRHGYPFDQKNVEQMTQRLMYGDRVLHWQGGPLQVIRSKGGTIRITAVTERKYNVGKLVDGDLTKVLNQLLSQATRGLHGDHSSTPDPSILRPAS